MKTWNIIEKILDLMIIFSSLGIANDVYEIHSEKNKYIKFFIQGKHDIKDINFIKKMLGGIWDTTYNENVSSSIVVSKSCDKDICVELRYLIEKDDSEHVIEPEITISVIKHYTNT